MRVPKYRWFLWAAVVAAALFFVFQMRFLPGGLGAPVLKGFELLDSLVRLIRNDYLEERDPLETAEGTYRGLVNSLDPLSAYLSPDLLESYRAQAGRFTEPGMVVLKRYAAFPQVVTVVESSPAASLGVKVGDVLSAVGGRNTLNMSLAEVKLLLRGTSESPVDVRVLRGNDTLELRLPRALLHPKAFSFSREAGRPAVLRVHRFAPPLVSDIRRDVVPSFKGKKAALILDLRGCQDGELEEARKLTNLFVKSADAGHFESRNGAKEAVACPDEPELGTVPVVVWIDAGTAGPAEFAAGVLQEIRKAKVVGSATTGLVGRTSLFPLKDSSAVLLTSGVFVLPSGRKLWDEGIVPDAGIPIDKLDERTYFEKTLPFLPKL